MIIEYHRPKNLDEAVALLNRSHPVTIPLGGGSSISRGTGRDVAVVDLQNLGLDRLQKNGNAFEIGAAARLQAMVEWNELPEGIRRILTRQFTVNIRNTATLAGSLVTATQTSEFAAAMLALDARLVWEPGGIEIPLGDWLPLRGKWTRGKLIIAIKFSAPAKLKINSISRTPMDQPIIGAALAQWASGRTRLVMVGFGEAPMCVFDGTEPAGLAEAAKNACSHFFKQDDLYQYKTEMVPVIIDRLVGEA